MKTFRSAGSQRMTAPRKKRSRQSLSREMHHIAHHLFNQLSVINLCSFKLQAKSRAPADQAMSDDLKPLQRAVEEATHWAERLSQVISQAAPPTEDRKPAPVKPANLTNNVVPLFVSARHQREKKIVRSHYLASATARFAPLHHQVEKRSHERLLFFPEVARTSYPFRILSCAVIDFELSSSEYVFDFDCLLGALLLKRPILI